MRVSADFVVVRQEIVSEAATHTTLGTLLVVIPKLRKVYRRALLKIWLRPWGFPASP